MDNQTGSMGAAIPSGAEALQRAIERRSQATGGQGVPTLSQSPLKSPQEQGVPMSQTSLGQTPAPTGQTAMSATPKSADEEERSIIVKALADRLKFYSKASEQQQKF